MLVQIIFSLLKMNQERMNSFFIKLQCARSPTDCILLFYTGINCQRGDLAYLDFALVCDLGF